MRTILPIVTAQVLNQEKPREWQSQAILAAKGDRRDGQTEETLAGHKAARLGHSR